MWELDHKEGWALKNWYFWTVVLEKTLESPLDCKVIKAVNPNRNQFWIFIRRTDADGEAPILWPPDAKNWLIGKGTDAGKAWRLGHMGMSVDEVVYCIISSMNKSLSNLQEILITGTPGVFQSMGLQIVGHNWETEQQQKQMLTLELWGLDTPELRFLFFFFNLLLI